jgi:hypothetical protein
MNDDVGELGGTFSLLACGSSGHWRVDLDESPDGTEWSLQLDAPRVYLAFAVHDLGVVRSAVDYLRSTQDRVNPLPLGHFASAAVSVQWDDEYADRCFLIVGLHARSALRLTLSADDTVMLAAALEQVLEDLPPEARANRGSAG